MDSSAQVQSLVEMGQCHKRAVQPASSTLSSNSRIPFSGLLGSLLPVPDNPWSAPTCPCQGVGTLARRPSLSEDCGVSTVSLWAQTATSCNLPFHQKKLLVNFCGRTRALRSKVKEVFARSHQQIGAGPASTPTHAWLSPARPTHCDLEVSETVVGHTRLSYLVQGANCCDVCSVELQSHRVTWWSPRRELIMAHWRRHVAFKALFKEETLSLAHMNKHGKETS